MANYRKQQQDYINCKWYGLWRKDWYVLNPCSVTLWWHNCAPHYRSPPLSASKWPCTWDANKETPHLQIRFNSVYVETVGGCPDCRVGGPLHHSTLRSPMSTFCWITNVLETQYWVIMLRQIGVEVQTIHYHLIDYLYRYQCDCFLIAVTATRWVIVPLWCCPRVSRVQRQCKVSTQFSFYNDLMTQSKFFLCSLCRGSQFKLS